ncbi:hypothetical protein Tco_1217766 [Tanacetum coccineum]
MSLMLFFRLGVNEDVVDENNNELVKQLESSSRYVNRSEVEPYNAKDVTALIEQNDCVRVELEKVKQHYKELYDSIKITRAHTSEKTSTMLNEIESLKAQLRSKESCFTSDYVKPKVLAPGMYAIDVKPIPHPLKNNRSAHLNYISHLKESVETVREIVEEARVVKPLDNTLNYACQYTKLSQELLEYVIGTCPKSFNERDNKAPSTPVTRKNYGSKPRSNTKKNRILPAKKENKKEVEVHLRTNKSVWTKVNRIDSSISSKRVVINSNSESVCKICDKCLNSANHEMCVVNILSSVNATPTVKRILNKGKHIWQPKGKLTDNKKPDLSFLLNKELEMLFQPMFDEYIEQSRVNEPVPSATDINAQVVPPGTSLSTTIAQDAHLFGYSHHLGVLIQEEQQLITLHDLSEDENQDHPLDNIVGIPLWELVPSSNSCYVIALKWIYNVKLDDMVYVLKQIKARLCKGYRQEEGIDLRFVCSRNPTHVYRLKRLFRAKAAPGVKIVSVTGELCVSTWRQFYPYAQPVLDVNDFWQVTTPGTSSAIAVGISVRTQEEVTPLLIPYGRFSKVIIYYLASNNNIHRRPDSAVHHTGDDYVLGNLKFVPKGESVEVFGMAIPDPLITEAIQQSSYYPKYLKMVAENTKKTLRKLQACKPATKRATPKKPTSPHQKGKPAFQLVDEEDEAQQESIPQREDDDPDLELAKKLSLETPKKGEETVVMLNGTVSEATPKLHEVVGKGKAVVTEEQVAHSLIDLSKKKRTTDQFILVRRDQTPPDSTTGPSSQPDDDTSEKVIHESSSTSDSERTESETEAAAPKGDKDQDEVDTSTVTSGVSIPVSDPEKAHEALAGPDPEPMKEDQTGSDSGKITCVLLLKTLSTLDDEFLATAYPKVHENLKLITDERVIDDKPESHSGSMSSMKNLDDTFNFGDQFLHDKPTEDDQEKSKAREESDSTIPDPSHQTVTSTPPVIAPFTDVSSSKPSLLVTPPPINTEATTITTSLPEITPFIALQLRVARLEQEMSEVKKTDLSADVLASIRSQVPTAVDNYLGTKLDDALLKSVKNQESEKSPKEIIKAKKEQGSSLQTEIFANYRLYHALMEALITDEDAMDKEVADKVKDHKRKHDSDDDEDDDDDEGPSAGSNQGRSTKRRRSDSAASGSAKPPPKADDQSSKKPRESEASASKQHPTLSSTGWQITDTREAGVDSSMQDLISNQNTRTFSQMDISSRMKGMTQI